MAANPAFANVPRIGVAAVSAANTNRDGTGTIVDVITGVTAGTRIERIILKATGDPADCIVNVFYFDGTTNFLFDAFDLENPAAGSVTVDTYRVERAYLDLVLPSATAKLRASITAAPTAGAVNVFALGADLT